MLSDWDTENGRKLKLFKINERWGIRNNSIPDTPSVIVHRCDNGAIGNVHDLIRNNYQCDHCKVPVPDDVQALWLLRTYEDAYPYWMKQGEAT